MKSCFDCFVKIYLQNFKTRDNMELFVVEPLVCFNTFFWHSLEECGKYFFMFLPATLCMLAATLNSHFLPPKMKCCKKRVKADRSFNLGHIQMIGMDLISWYCYRQIYRPDSFIHLTIWMIFQHQRIMRNPGKGTHLSPTAQQPRWEQSWEKTFE